MYLCNGRSPLRIDRVIAHAQAVIEPDADGLKSLNSRDVHFSRTGGVGAAENGRGLTRRIFCWRSTDAKRLRRSATGQKTGAVRYIHPF